MSIKRNLSSTSSVENIIRSNTVIKKIEHGYVVSERYYNNRGRAHLDINYTCHGNSHSSSSIIYMD